MDDITRALLGDHEAEGEARRVDAAVLRNGPTSEKCDNNATEMRPGFKPLTLEQLMEMDGKPVWIHNLEEPDKSQWRLCHWDRGKYLVLQGISVRGYLVEEYGKSWIAYACPPAHINREEWSGCDFCQKELDDYPYIAAHGDFSGSDTCYEPSYCPVCGRPLTDEAWAELEKRIGGAK